MSLPVIHSRHCEQAVEVVHIHLRVHAREGIHRLVVMNGVPRADKLVCKAYVLKDLSIVPRASERCQVRIDCLLGYQREFRTTKNADRTFWVPGSIWSLSWMMEKFT